MCQRERMKADGVADVKDEELEGEYAIHASSLNSTVIDELKKKKAVER